MAHYYAGEISCASRVGHVGKIKIEDHFRFVDATGYDQIGVHRALIPVDHEVRINPVVKGAFTFAYSAGLLFSSLGHERAPLQAEALAVFDHVLAVVEHAVKTLMQVWHVVTAVKIVVDEYLPVAVKSVMTALEPLEPEDLRILRLESPTIAG